jgi:hypothetical protein
MRGAGIFWPQTLGHRRYGRSPYNSSFIRRIIRRGLVSRTLFAIRNRKDDAWQLNK